MVVTLFPAAADTGMTHARIGSPSRWTVHAPHCARPQPKCGLFSARSLRRAYRSGMFGSTSTETGLPSTTNLIVAMIPPWWDARSCLGRAARREGTRADSTLAESASPQCSARRALRPGSSVATRQSLGSAEAPNDSVVALGVRDGNPLEPVVLGAAERLRRRIDDPLADPRQSALLIGNSGHPLLVPVHGEHAEVPPRDRACGHLRGIELLEDLQSVDFRLPGRAPIASGRKDAESQGGCDCEASDHPASLLASGPRWGCSAHCGLGRGGSTIPSHPTPLGDEPCCLPSVSGPARR